MGVDLPKMMQPTTSPFDQIRRFRPDGTEYWAARDMMEPLGYQARNWQRFLSAIGRAKLACGNSGQDIEAHFTYISDTPQGGGPPRVDVEMSRYACSLVAMNGDPTKPEVAAAQQYFAVMTRVAELASSAPALSERRLAAIESTQSDTANLIRDLQDDLDQMTRRLALVDAKASYAEHAVTGASGFRTIHSWAKQRGVHLTSRQSRVEGEACASMSATARFPVGSIPRADGRSTPIFSTQVLELWLVGYLRRQNERPSLFSRSVPA